MKVLLSIKPEFANKIFDGEKKYEFRRAIFKRDDIDTVVVYASAPISKIIGEFEIESVCEDEIFSLWGKTKHSSGISKEYFLKYFDGKENGYAIKVKSHVKYEEPVSLAERYGVKPPQSFMYVQN